MKALIFAAGLGTRLRPLTDTLPKALVPVCGEPLLYHVIQKLKAAGYTQLTVNVHHFPEQIRAYIASRNWGIPIAISDESEALLETGGGILHARGDDMRLMGWMDNETGKVRSPYPDLDLTSCHKYAFSGIHNLSPRIFPHFEEWGFTGRFPIMDFYLKTCHREPIYGILAEDLQLVDVGKFDQLEQAQQQCAALLGR